MLLVLLGSAAATPLPSCRRHSDVGEGLVSEVVRWVVEGVGARARGGRAVGMKGESFERSDEGGVEAGGWRGDVGKPWRGLKARSRSAS